MEEITKTIGKFWFPTVCILGGLLFLANASGQSTDFMLGALGVLIVGILALLFVLDVIKRKVAMLLGFIFAGGAIAYGFLTYDSVETTIEDIKMKAEVKSQTIQRLKDLRDAQVAYEEVNGVFTTDLGELVSFIKSGALPTIKKIGAIPDSIGTEANARELGMIVKMPAGMSDEEIKKQGLIVRDTVMIPVMEAVFTNDIAMKRRKFDLDIEKLVYAPKSGKPWEVKAGTLDAGGVERPYLMIKDPAPIYDGEALTVGSTEEAHTNGNWKED